MKKNLTRVLALAMALLMCLSLLPVSALAGDADFAAMIASAQAAQAAAMGGAAPDVPFAMPEQALDYTDPNVCLASEDGQHLWIEVHDPAYICAWGDCTEENPHILYKSCAYCKESAEPLYANELEAIQIEAQVFAETQEEIPPEQYDDWDYRAYHKYIFELPDHFYEKQDGQAPTCTAGGHTAYEQCSVCEEIRGYEELDPLGHNWGDYTVTVEPTCTAAGTKMRECLRCGEKEYVDIPALGHDWGEFVTVKEPTCTETGTTKRVCERCGAEDFGEIPANGHSYGDFTILKEATCTEDGSKEHTCAVCEYKETVVIPAAHTWGDFTVTKEATCTEAGEKEHTCLVCEFVETETIPATGIHTWDNGVCTVCGAEKLAEPTVEEPAVEEPKDEEPKDEEPKDEEPKEEPKDELKEEPKEEPKEELKEELKDEPKEELKEEPKEEPKEELKEEPAGAQPVGAIVEDCRDMYSSFGAFLTEQNVADAKYVVASYTPVDANGHALGEVPAGGVRFDLPLPEGADAASVQVYTYDYSTYSWSPANFFLSDGQATVSSGAYPYPPFAVLAAPAASGNSGETTPTKQEAVSAEVADEFKNLLNEKGLSNDSGDIVLQDVTPLREDGSEMSNEEVAAMGGVTFEMDLPENYKEGDELEIYHQNSETGEWELVTEYTINGNKVVFKLNHFSPSGIVLKGATPKIPEIAGIKLTGGAHLDVRSAFVGETLEPDFSPFTGVDPVAEGYTYQWYRTNKNDVDYPIPDTEHGNDRQYTIIDKDLDYAISCAIIKTETSGEKVSERTDGLRVRKAVRFAVEIKGMGTVRMVDIDEIVPTVKHEYEVINNPQTLQIDSITGNSFTITMEPFRTDPSNLYYLRSYTATSTALGNNITTVSEAAKNVSFTVTATADGQKAVIYFDRPNCKVAASDEEMSQEDIKDHQNWMNGIKPNSVDALETLIKTLANEYSLNENEIKTLANPGVVYVQPKWTSDSQFMDNQQIIDIGGLSFDLDYPAGVTRVSHVIQVYHYKDGWGSPLDSNYIELGTEKITVKNYTDFSPFAVLALPSVALTFERNGATGGPNMPAKTAVKGSSINAPKCDFTYDGKVFMYWRDVDNSKTYYVGDPVTMSGNITLTAQWADSARIRYNPGEGGSGEMASEDVPINESVTLTANAFSRKNHSFVGWKDQHDAGYADGGSFVPKDQLSAGETELVLTAQWKRDKYTVSFNGNGGGGEMAPKDVVAGGTITVPKCTFTVPYGKVFAYWSDTADGTEKICEDEGSFTPEGDNDITLYAIWKDALTVGFYCNGGEGGPYKEQTDIPKGVSTALMTIKELGYTPLDGKTFAGWNEKQDGSGTKTYKDGEEVELTENKVLYAQWADSIIVTFKANKGVGTDKTQEVPSGVATELKAFDTMSFKRSGFEFTGWNTTATGNGTPYADKDPINITENTTLYAQWKEAEITVKPTITGNKSGTSKNGYTGEILEVKIKDPAFSESELTFTWYRDDASTQIGTGKTYQTTAADFGHEIFCRASYDDGTISTYKDSDSKLFEGVAKVQDMINYGYTLLGVPGELATIRGVVPGMKYSVDGVNGEVTDDDMTGNPADNLFVATKMGTYVFYDSTKSAESDPVEVVSWLSFGHKIQNSTSTTASGTSNSGSGRVTWKVDNSSLNSGGYYPSTASAESKRDTAIIMPYGTNIWIIREDAVGTVDLVMTVSPSSGSYAHTYLNDSSLINNPFSNELQFYIKPDYNVIPNIYVTYFSRSSTSPRTADDSHLGLWSALCFMSLAGATVLLNGQRKRRKARR